MKVYDYVGSNKRDSFLLLITVFFVLLGVGYIVSYMMGDLTIALIFGIFSIIYILASYYYSDKIVLAVSNAKEADEKEYAHLHNVVEGMAIAAGIPKPKVYVVNDSAPNAFATGRDPQHSVIAVTTGLLGLMNREELEGVVAHEMSHIKNYDIRFMTLVVVVIGLISMIADVALRMFIFGGNHREGKSPVLLVIGIVFIILAPIFATLVQFAISRKREFLADATGALITRYPPGLANALEKLKTHDTKVRSATAATAPLYIAEPIKKSFTNLFSTHPPIDERIQRLREM